MRGICAAVVVAIAMVLASGCVSDTSSNPDGGGPDAASPDGNNGDAGGAPCVFGTSHFGDGCKFGP